MNTRLKYLQSIWSWRMLIDLYQNITNINMEESSLTKAVKTSYSWLPREKVIPLLIVGTGRAVVLFALFSSGDWIWYITKDTTDSKNFWKFLILLAKFIELWTQLNILEWRIFLDNASIHLSDKTRHTSKKLGLRMRSLPQYSPRLAPVEIVFGMMKRIIAMKKEKKVIRFSLLNGRKEVSYSLKKFSKTKALRLWSVFVYEAKKAILRWRGRKASILWEIGNTRGNVRDHSMQIDC